MGNHMSCISPAGPRQQYAPDYNKKLIKFLDVCETGAISELEGPLTAAEVMIEFPAQFLCCFSSVVSSGRCRISAVPADEELRATEIYMLLPMHKVNTRFSTEDMAVLAALVSQSCTAGKQSRKGAFSQSKVAPLPGSMSSTEGSNSECGFLGSVSFKQLGTPPVSINMQGRLPALVMNRGAAADGGNHKTMCRAKSWKPNLETIRETNVALISSQQVLDKFPL